MRRPPRRPGHLRDLGDTWVNIQTERELEAAEKRALESQSTAYIDTRSGAARTAPMRGIRSPGPARLSAPDFLMTHAGWYRDYMRKVMG
jgi:hypothetical protein